MARALPPSAVLFPPALGGEAGIRLEHATEILSGCEAGAGDNIGYRKLRICQKPFRSRQSAFNQLLLNRAPKCLAEPLLDHRKRFADECGNIFRSKPLLDIS